MKLDCRLASEVLPEVDWTSRAIVWLDYDGKLDAMVLSDLDTVITRARSGSCVVVSVNASIERDPDSTGRGQYESETGLPYDLDAYRLRETRRRIGEALPKR